LIQGDTITPDRFSHSEEWGSEAYDIQYDETWNNGGVSEKEECAPAKVRLCSENYTTRFWRFQKQLERLTIKTDKVVVFDLGKTI
jgi:hypothetical protein